MPQPLSLINTPSQLAEAVDFYLSPSNATHLEAIRALASQPPTAQNDALLLGYALESLRLTSSTAVHFQATALDSLSRDDGTAVPVQPGDRITVACVRPPFYIPPPRYLSTSATHTNHGPIQASSINAPDQTIDPSRPRDTYAHLAAIPSNAFLGGGREIGEAALTEMFRAVFGKAGLRRAPGPQGELKKVVGVRGDGVVEYLREDWGGKGEWPGGMKVCWDEE